MSACCWHRLCWRGVARWATRRGATTLVGSSSTPTRHHQGHVMRTISFLAGIIACDLVLISAAAPTSAAQTPGASSSFTLAQVKSYPFPNELTSAARGGRIAYALNEQGRRNIWVADAPEYKPRQPPPYSIDDGQELTSVSLSADGRNVVYVRGGDHGSNWTGTAPNPL